MRNLGIMIFLSAGMLLTGCLKDLGTKEPPKDLNNGNFTVAPSPDQGSGDTGNSSQNSSDENQNSNSNNTVTPINANDPEGLPDGFTINKGNKLTTSNILSLEYSPPFDTAFVQISENDTCSGGAWIRYSETQNYSSKLTNLNLALSVRFRDYDQRLSPCYVRRIIVDQAGPEIIFAKYPSAPVEEGSDVEIVINVTDSASGVKDVVCSLGALSKACSAGQNTITLPKLAEGDYTLKVSASDQAGFSSEKSISFSVSSSLRKMSQLVNVTANNKVDILFVIDNSGSMAYEQKSMASRVRNFLDVVKGLDWQIAVTTTDPVSNTLGDGRLVPLYGKTNSYIMKSSMSDLDAKNTLSMTLQRPETGSGNEQAIYASYRAIERSLASVGGNTNFIRQDAQLALVVISDEDESQNGFKNDPTNFVNFIQTTFNGQKALSFHSVIAKPGDLACLNGEGYAAGFRYEQLSKMTGGVIGDVCASDYAAQVQGIAEGVRKTLKSITLSCSPVVDSLRSVLVLKDGQVYNGPRKIEGLNLVFDDMLPSGNYEVMYSCLK